MNLLKFTKVVSGFIGSTATKDVKLEASPMEREELTSGQYIDSFWVQ